MRPILLVVPREAEGSRLDRFLASTLSAMEGGPSRTELQRWIEHGGVTVDGAEVALDAYPRYDNPWTTVPFDADEVAITAGRFALGLDFTTWTRTASASPLP